MESPVKYKGFKETLLESTPTNLPIYKTPPTKRYYISIPLSILCIAFGWHFFEIFAIKLHQNSLDFVGYYNYSLLHLFSIFFLSIPSMYLIEIDVSIALILSCCLEILSCIFSYLIRYRILIEFQVFTSILAMTLFFKSLGKIANLWHLRQEKSLVLISFMCFIIFGGGISLLFYYRKPVEWGTIKKIFAIIKIILISSCLPFLINPFPDNLLSQSQYERFKYKNNILEQISPCFFSNWKIIISFSFILSSFVFLFLSHIDPQENMLRTSPLIIGILFFLTIYFVFIVYYYFKKISDYVYLQKVSLLVGIIFYIMLMFYLLISKKKKYYEITLFINLIQVFLGFCFILFIIISYDNLCEEGYPYGESVILSICEMIISFLSLIMLKIDYNLRSNTYNTNERWVEILIFLFPFSLGCFLFLPVGENYFKGASLADLNKLSITEENTQ